MLEQDKVGLDRDCFVDGVHLTDLGMHYYALAYEKIIRKIFNEPIESSSTLNPAIKP